MHKPIRSYYSLFMLRTFTRFAPAVALGLTLSLSAFGQDRVRSCSTMEVLERQLLENPDLAAKLKDAEERTAEYVNMRKSGRVAAVNVTIPVVVHVIYRTAAENISDAQVNSQIAILNADYAGLNSDFANVPSLFAGIKSGSGIQFCLAKTDPNGNPTTGINRVATTRTSFTSNDGVKSSSTGGANAWNSTKYLNIWVCTLGGGLLGYAQFPNTGTASTDGVVILNTAFGNTGTAAAPFNKGRTATHEVGHWLNLRHIWGDATCGNDQVNDTPTQSTANYGCPTFPKPTCGNTSDMFMNYMDYVDDACMYTFSAGQVARMEATFSSGGGRTGFLTSTACTAGPPPSCAVPASLAASSITQTSASLSWGAASGAVSYNLQYKTAAASTWTTVNTTATSYALSGLTAGTSYQFQVQNVCSGSSSAYSSAASFSTLSSGTVSYCANAGGSTADEWLAYFALGTIANTSGAQNGAGYEDFTALSTNLLPGSSYSAVYKGGFRSGYTATEYYRVWIDYNRDGDFLDAGETVFSRSSSSKSNLSNTFTVPATASLGKTRLRIAMKYGSQLSAACTGYGTGWGQVEDYSVIIGSGTGRFASTGMTVDLAPNPAAEFTLVHATLPEGVDHADVRVFDLQGRMVWHADAIKADNSRIEGFAVPVSELKAGIYMLQVDAAGVRKNVRLAVE